MINKNGIKIITAICILLLATLACDFAFSSATITDVYMSFDQDGLSRTTVFSPEDVIIYCQVDLAAAPEDTVVKVQWIAVDINDDTVPPNTFLDETEIVGTGPFYFYYDNDPYLWPTGQYRVDVYLNGEFQESENFSVSE